MIPLAHLGVFSAHENQLLARQAKHVAKQQPQICKLLLIIARHLAKQRPLSVDDLVVGQGQNKVFVERIIHAEGELAVMKLAVDRIKRHVAECVVHPAHVPL